MSTKITQIIETVLYGQSKNQLTNLDNPNPEDSGCVGIVFLLFLFLAGLATCSSTYVIAPKNSEVCAQSLDLTFANPNELSDIVNTKNESSFYTNIDSKVRIQNAATDPLDLAIIIWIDVSASIGQGLVPKVYSEQIAPILDILEQINGSLAIGLLGANTKEEMLFISNSDEKIVMPVRRDNQDAAEYRTDLLKWKKKQARQSAVKISYAQKRNEFMSDLRELLDYSSLDNKSLICEGINLSNRIFEQPNHKGSQRILLMVTDYFSNGSDKCPIRLKSDIDLISVNRLSHANTPIML